MKYCTGAIDGIAIKIKIPSKKYCSNQLDYHSGNKNVSCINTQAVCDSNSRFIAITATNTGSTNDIAAFNSTSLKELNCSQEFPYHWVGDQAYVLSETMLVPFPGKNLSADKIAFNFFQSQVRINIECAFGILVRRWGVLWKKIEFDLPTAAKIVIACATLHNFCIDFNQLLPPYCNEMPEVDNNGVLVGNIWKINNNVTDQRISMSANNAYLEGSSSLQRAIVKRIIEENISVN